MCDTNVTRAASVEDTLPLRRERRWRKEWAGAKQRFRLVDSRGGMTAFRISVLLLAALVAGCAELPGRGPSAIAIESKAVAEPTDESYLVVDIDPTVAEIVGKVRSREFQERFSIPSASTVQRIGIGDTVAVNIWEAGPNGLFSSSAGKSNTLQSVVDETGTIFVPYVGRVRAAGSTVESVRIAIQQALADKAIQPQVQVVVSSNLTNSVVVFGDVGSPGRFPITPNGTRVLDLVAQAGGSKFPTYDTLVMLKRGGQTGAVLLDDLFEIPQNNVYLKADDTIMVANFPRTFTVFGAARATELFKFDARAVTLAEALARAGGLDDNTADPGGVFLFRYETSATAEKLRPDSKLIRPGFRVPVVYRLDLNNPSSFFLARFIEIQDKDLIYIANSPSVDLLKFLKIVQGVTAATKNVADAWYRLDRLGNGN